MAPKKNKASSLSLKTFPPDLLARVNAKAAFLGMDQAEFVVAALERATKDLKQVHADTKRRWEEENG